MCPAWKPHLRRSRDAVRALTEGVLDAVEQTRTSLAMVTGLETVSRRIDNVIDKIALIAVQITMLAVSGAVEAARAGESGSGFALVSGDIRGLAQEASASADQVKDTVRNILEQIASVRRSLDHIIESADAEAEKNRLAFAALDRVEEDLAALGAANTVILQNAAAVSDAVTQTASGARLIAAAAEEASAASRQAATAASEQARSAEDLAAAIEEIASLADALSSWRCSRRPRLTQTAAETSTPNRHSFLTFRVGETCYMRCRRRKCPRSSPCPPYRACRIAHALCSAWPICGGMSSPSPASATCWNCPRKAPWKRPGAKVVLHAPSCSRAHPRSPWRLTRSMPW